MKPIFFPHQQAFRDWLELNHLTTKELIVGFYKVGIGKPSMTWSESVDQALCFGWIDGVRRSIDDESYCIRFTPRRPGSNWSEVNIRKVEELSKAGLVKAEGLKAYNFRVESNSGIYSFESKPLLLDSEYEQLFKSTGTAWEFYLKQPPSYRKATTQWIMSAKQEKTRLSRLEKLIESFKNQQRL